MILKNVRFQWMYTFQTKKNPFGAEEKYEVTVIIKKDNTAALDEFKKSIQEALDKANNASGPKAIQIATFKLKDGDSEIDNPKAYEYLKGCYFFTTKNKKQPEAYKAIKANGQILKVVATKDDYYNGMNGICICNPFVYNAAGKKGIAMYLNGIIKTSGGEKLGGNNIQDVDIEDLDLSVEDTKNDDDWAVL